MLLIGRDVGLRDISTDPRTLIVTITDFFSSFGAVLARKLQ
jgi:hypothetical protein